MKPYYIWDVLTYKYNYIFVSVTNLDDLTKYFFNLMFLSKTLEANAYSNTGTYGTILLNPDMLGYLGNTNRVEVVMIIIHPGKSGCF
ncbi:hypothetical protein A6J40_17535 [Legionella longbeachae]|nr:hypothetical protein A6J40_17535 [Legionella longbeachae]ARM32992.1 hypothetical protein B0B39_05420 [Legionella longbeachae]QIN32954.1 hypothetical protein GCB94_12785 [Legionella longbeachae]QIN36255.1 hypothetical protein GCS73_11785 [Legionella longbeachae]RZV24477.1 hypothetical protein EKG34_10445 [Legionella longbeachae]